MNLSDISNNATTWKISRVRNYTTIRNIVVLILAVSYFAVSLSERQSTLKILAEGLLRLEKVFRGSYLLQLRHCQRPLQSPLLKQNRHPYDRAEEKETRLPAMLRLPS